MNCSKILKYATLFLKKAEYIERDPFSNVIEKANIIIQQQINDNKKYYANEYFGGANFSIDMIDGNPGTSELYFTTNPEIKGSTGVEKETNKRYFENELSDKVSPLGLNVKIV